MRQIVSLVTLGLALLALVLPAAADIINVPTDYADIQDAIDAAGPGDEIHFAPGTYHGPDGFLVDRGWISFVGDGEVILTGEHAYPDGFFHCDPVNWAFAPIRFSNLIFEGNHNAIFSPNGSSCTLIIEDCVFREHVGRAVYLIGAGHLTVEDCLFEDNDHTACGTISADFEIRDCVFRNNTSAIQTEDGASGGSQLVERCLIVDQVYYGVSSIMSDHLVLRNCTVVNSSAAGYGIFNVSQDGHLTVENCIIASSEGSAFDCDTNSHFTVLCSDVWDNAEGNWGCGAHEGGADGCFSADPLFCNLAEGDYGIDSESPCAPANNSCGVLIGAYPVDCGVTSVESLKHLPWSVVKSCY